jgi:hypothetical protein
VPVVAFTADALPAYLNAREAAGAAAALLVQNHLSIDRDRPPGRPRGHP